jgi:DMSO/TMAO reductase YedYZ heme-binding membrane subunit
MIHLIQGKVKSRLNACSFYAQNHLITKALHKNNLINLSNKAKVKGALELDYEYIGMMIMLIMMLMLFRWRG